jgi:hypothetical protein
MHNYTNTHALHQQANVDPLLRMEARKICINTDFRSRLRFTGHTSITPQETCFAAMEAHLLYFLPLRQPKTLDRSIFQERGGQNVEAVVVRTQTHAPREGACETELVPLDSPIP